VILCIDSGNSRVKLGLGDRHGWQRTAALPRQQLLTDLEKTLAAWPRPQRAMACNVAGSAVAADIAAILGRLAIPLAWLASSECRGEVRNGYDRPEQLGADRWAALIGARQLHAGACLVVGAGTATTVDLLTADGVFRGGLILPGLALMRRSLAGAAAQLPDARGRHHEVPRNTDDAIVSGAIEATVGAIERIYRRIVGQPTPACLLTGGAAAELEPHLQLPLRRIDDLVLQGLLFVASENGPRSSPADSFAVT
jgi:type III pantothenate kinase